MPYKKHQIYINHDYSTEENAVYIPDSAKWGVSHHQSTKGGHGIFSPSRKGPIMMYLNDDEGNFWPVMSFLTNEEAGALAIKLLTAVKDNIVKEAQRE